MAADVFLFRIDDGRTREERLKAAALSRSAAKSMGGKGISGGRGGSLADRQHGADPWRIARTERGKPYFPDQPELHFSISHSGDFWVCAFSACPVGVDIQKHVKKRGESEAEAASRFLKMAERFFHPEEAAWVSEAPYGRFFRIWTAKESYVKYTGTGIGGDFDRFCLAPVTDPSGSCWEAEQVRFYSTELLNGYTLSVCFEQQEKTVQFYRFDEINR